jgi:hypothetical protein
MIRCPTPSEKKINPQSWQIDQLELRNIALGMTGENGGGLKIQSLSGSVIAQHTDNGYEYGFLTRPLKFLVTDCELRTAFKYHELKSRYACLQHGNAQTFRAVGIHLKPKVNCTYTDLKRTIYHPPCTIYGTRSGHLRD